MSVNRVFIFHETSDNFRAFGFAGAGQASENWDPGLTTIRGAAANATHIYVLDLSTNPAIVRRWQADQTRDASNDITMTNTGAYNGIALTDTHLVALRAEELQYYDLTTGAYVASMDATLPSLTSPGFYSGICRAGEFLYLSTHNDSTFQPRIYKRNLDGSAVTDWAGQSGTTGLTIFATTDRVVTVRKNGGHWDRWSFDGTQDTTINTIGSGVWQASYTTYQFPDVPTALSVSSDDESLTVNWELPASTPGLPVDGFRVSVDGVTWIRKLVTDRSHRFTGLTNGQTYTVSVQATAETYMSASATIMGVPNVVPLSIEAIDEQFIALNTEDYDLVIDIPGNPDTVEAKGHMEGFIQDWDAINGQLHIKSDKVTRLISGVNWDIEVVKNMQTLMRQIAYNVIQAAPIFETLDTIHLYRGVPINFDIVIQNIPPLLIPNARLLGLKSDLVDYGVSVKGQIGTTDNFTMNTGNVRIIVPSESGGDDTVYDFPYQIEAGSPPAIGTPKFTPRGIYGSLEVAEVTNALGYEWTLQEGDAATWNFFNNTRTVIDPATVEVTPGHLNVTLTFSNIAAASRYEYQLVSENVETPWKAFTGTLSNGMITTIIPDLEDGVQYTLRLRVASPWVGTPISITVYGGRFAYCIHHPNTGDNVLYLFHTGLTNGGTATRIKRFLLPATLTEPGGLAVDADQNVYILNAVDRGEKALYVFNASVIDAASDGDRIAPSRKNPLPTTTHVNILGFGLSVYDNELYVLLNRGLTNSQLFSNGRTIASLSATDGQTLVGLHHTNFRAGQVTSRNQFLHGCSLTDNYIFVMSSTNSQSAVVDLYERNSGLDLTERFQSYALSDEADRSITRGHVTGLKVIDDVFYFFNETELVRAQFSRAGRYQQEWYINLPLGLTNPLFLDML